MSALEGGHEYTRASCSGFWVSFLLPILSRYTLDHIEVVDSCLLSQISQTYFPSILLYCVETSIPKFKVPLQKDLLQVGEVLVFLTVQTT